MNESVFYIAGMDCPTEEQLIRARLGRMDGVESLRFDLMARELTVAHHLPDDGELVAALESVGMAPQRKTPPPPKGLERSVFQLPGMC